MVLLEEDFQFHFFSQIFASISEILESFSSKNASVPLIGDYFLAVLRNCLKLIYYTFPPPHSIFNLNYIVSDRVLSVMILLLLALRHLTILK